MQAFSNKRHRHRHDLHIFRCLQCASVLAYTCNVLHHALLHHHEEADQGKVYTDPHQHQTKDNTKIKVEITDKAFSKK